MAAEIRAEVSAQVESLKASLGRAPGLAVVIVGERKDSQTYVRNKVKACAECGIFSLKIELPEDVTQAEVMKHVKALNLDAAIDGILVQLPLPKHLDDAAILDEISVEKDVDGFHPANIGLLAMRGREPHAKPCTPHGIIEMLRRSHVRIDGALAVVVGRSNVVGMPISLMLLQEHATVQILHTKTPPEEMQRAIASADILVACAGVPRVVKGEWVKEGAVVIDVGVNAVDDPSIAKGYRLVGDVDFETARTRASKITPVPGGVGPMTIAMLMHNTERLARTRATANTISSN